MSVSESISASVDYNFHTHTPRCGHAVGSEREYIESAIEHGFKKLGFSDHTPQPFDNGFVSSIRMDMSQLDGYVGILEELREEYKDRIELHIGLEAEYYPKYFNRLLEEIKDRGIEYLILGQHFTWDEENGFYAGNRTDREDDLASYVDETIEALDTGKFLYLAHPDLINYTGDEKTYIRHMSRLCEYARDHEILLEINALGHETGRWYPRKDFFSLASSMGCQFVYGCDAHDPHMVLKPEEVHGLDGFLKETGVTFEDLTVTAVNKKS